MRTSAPTRAVYTYAGAGAAGAGGAGAWPPPVLTRSFNSLLGLKNGIFLAGTSTRSPVLGFLPTRGLRWRVRKLPKPRISILSPARSERTTLSKMVSTITSLSLRVNSARRETSSIKSAFVITWLSSPVNSLNLLKFQGLDASHRFWNILTSTNNKIPHAAPASSWRLANNRKDRRSSGQGASADPYRDALA